MRSTPFNGNTMGIGNANCHCPLSKCQKYHLYLATNCNGNAAPLSTDIHKRLLLFCLTPLHSHGRAAGRCTSPASCTHSWDYYFINSFAFSLKAMPDRVQVKSGQMKGLWSGPRLPIKPRRRHREGKHLRNTSVYCQAVCLPSSISRFLILVRSSCCVEDGQPHVYFRTFEGVNINDMVHFYPPPPPPPCLAHSGSSHHVLFLHAGLGRSVGFAGPNQIRQGGSICGSGEGQNCGTHTHQTIHTY